MVRLAERNPAVYVVLDGERPIGRIEAPAGTPVLERGSGTVLLLRPGRTESDRGSPA